MASFHRGLRDDPEVNQSPVERSLGILARFQDTCEDSQTEDDIEFLRSLMYALQQNGIDDTDFIPPYLLEETEEEDISGTDEMEMLSQEVSNSFRLHNIEAERAVKSWLLSTYCRKREEKKEDQSTERERAHSMSITPGSKPSFSFSVSQTKSPKEFHSIPSSSSFSFSSSPSSSRSLEGSISTSRSFAEGLSLPSSPQQKLSPSNRRKSPLPPRYYSGSRKSPRLSGSSSPPLSSLTYLDDSDIIISKECGKALEERHLYSFNIIDAKRTSPNFGYLLVSRIFEDWGFFKNFKIDRKILRRFVQKVSLGYHPNPYHNFTHALDVFQTLHYFLRMVSDAGYFDKYEVLALLVSALVHDLGHDGFSNAFHIKTFSQRALSHNDLSPQENHHLMAAFAILRNEDFNIFNVFNEEEFSKLREFMIDVVLHTDMSNHFEMERNLKTFLQNKGTNFGENKESKKRLGSVLLHMADISNPSKTFTIARYWACNFCEESFNQGKKEKELGLPISPMCDQSSAATFPAGQIGFINFIVVPYYQVISEILPGVQETALPNLKENLRVWGMLEGKSVPDLVLCGALPSLLQQQQQQTASSSSSKGENGIGKEKKKKKGEKEDKKEEKGGGEKKKEEKNLKG